MQTAIVTTILKKLQRHASESLLLEVPIVWWSFCAGVLALYLLRRVTSPVQLEPHHLDAAQNVFDHRDKPSDGCTIRGWRCVFTVMLCHVFGTLDNIISVMNMSEKFQRVCEQFSAACFKIRCGEADALTSDVVAPRGSRDTPWFSPWRPRVHRGLYAWL